MDEMVALTTVTDEFGIDSDGKTDVKGTPADKDYAAVDGGSDLQKGTAAMVASYETDTATDEVRSNSPIVGGSKSAAASPKLLRSGIGPGMRVGLSR